MNVLHIFSGSRVDIGEFRNRPTRKVVLHFWLIGISLYKSEKMALVVVFIDTQVTSV